MTLYKNAGLAVSMESALGSALTISAATNADPGVFTSAGHGLSNGDLILLEVLGMTQVNNRIFVVYGSATDTFQLEDKDGSSGIDTTSFGTFTSGTAKEVTMGTSITGVANMSGSGGDPIFLDSTTVHDLDRKQTINGSNPMSYSLSMQWDPGDAGQAAMIDAYQLQASKGFKIQWPNGRFMLFRGSVGYSGLPGGESQGITSSPAAIAMEGNPTFGI